MDLNEVAFGLNEVAFGLNEVARELKVFVKINDNLYL
jgi:hypothetical protein